MPSASFARPLYLLLTAIGTLVPLAWCWPWLAAHGLDVPMMLSELFSTRIGGFFGLDVVCSALTLFALVFIETRRRAIRGAWWAIPATLCIGVSCGLPLFLYLRQRSLDANLPSS